MPKAVFALAALDYALRAAKSAAWMDLAASVLSAALMVGSKFGNLPLLLPWAVALVPAIRVFFRRPALTLAVGAMAIFCASLPINLPVRLRL